MAHLMGENCYDLWMCFIIANYLTNIEARGSLNCLDCDSNRECNNYYCLTCKEGGLCPMKFKTNQPHDHHPWLQVRRISKENVVNAVEVETFLGENANRIQKFIGNKENVFKLKTPVRSMGKRVKAFEDPLQLVCRGCDYPISKTSNSKDGVEVCSIECLITYAKQIQQFECLKLKEGIDLQNQDFECPLTMEEKNQKTKTSALESIPMSSAHGVRLGVRLGASTTKEEDGGGACAPMTNQTWRRETHVASTMVKDEEVKETPQASATHVIQMVDPSETQVHVYDYSAFPLRYQCRNLDLLCEIFDVDID